MSKETFEIKIHNEYGRKILSMRMKVEYEVFAQNLDRAIIKSKRDGCAVADFGEYIVCVDFTKITIILSRIEEDIE